MKVYIGDRNPTTIIVEDHNTTPCYRLLLRHVVFHSPTGMEWGYGGSGPADLALSILADVLNEQPTREQLSRGEPLCWKLHQEFKREYIVTAGRAGFSFTEELVWSWLRNYGIEPGKNRPTADQLDARLRGVARRYHQEARMLWQRCPCCEGAGHHDGDHCFTCDGRGDFGDWS